MRRFFSFILLISFLILVLFGVNQSLSRSAKKAGAESLTIYNWGGLYRSYPD